MEDLDFSDEILTFPRVETCLLTWDLSKREHFLNLSRRSILLEGSCVQLLSLGTIAVQKNIFGWIVKRFTESCFFLKFLKPLFRRNTYLWHDMPQDEKCIYKKPNFLDRFDNLFQFFLNSNSSSSFFLLLKLLS